MSDSPYSYDALSSIVFIVGIYEGVLPFVAKLFDFHPKLAFPTRMSSPGWWIVSGLVIVVAVVLLEALDQARKRAAA